MNLAQFIVLWYYQRDITSYIKQGQSIEDLTDSQNSKRPHNLISTPKRRSKTLGAIQDNNQSRHLKPEPKRPRKRRNSSKKNFRHKTHTEPIQLNRKRKNRRKAVQPNRKKHKIANLVKQEQNILGINEKTGFRESRNSSR